MDATTLESTNNDTESDPLDRSVDMSNGGTETAPAPEHRENKQADAQGANADEDFVPDNTGEGDQDKDEEGSAARMYPIGQVGLAAAREAPGKQEEREAAQSAQQPDTDVNNPSQTVGEVAEPRVIEKVTEPTSPAKETVNTSNRDPTPDTSSQPPTLTEVDSLEEVKQAGEVEEPELPRSAPPPPPPASASAPTANPSGPFGRIGHPGAGSHEMEAPNPDQAERRDQDPAPAQKTVGIQIEWNDNELKRDEAKTIVSPSARKQDSKTEDTTDTT